jgi:ribonuclease P protein component
VKQSEPLRGYAAFDRVLNGGRKIGGALTLCVYLIERTERAALHVGYAVSSKRFNAVRRNRVRRLMREAVRFESVQLCRVLAELSFSADLVFIFRPRPDVDTQRLSLAPMRADIADVLGRLAARIVEGAHA